MNPEPMPAVDFLDLYDEALPQVYGYLIARVGVVGVAEDLTSETFMAGVAAVNRGQVDLSVGWFIAVARNKLVDHWRRLAREERGLRAVADTTHPVVDPWESDLHAGHARDVLATLGPHHRTVLTLRYLDGLAVVQVAQLMGRTLHATEALLTRARHAFRRAYEESGE